MALSKSLTFQYDKMLYLVEPTEENTRITGEKIKAYNDPDCTSVLNAYFRLWIESLACWSNMIILLFFRLEPDHCLQQFDVDLGVLGGGGKA